MANDKKAPPKKVKRPSALKRFEQSEVNKERNRSFTAKAKTAMKKLETMVSGSEKQAVSDQLSAVYSLLDKGVKKGMFKANKASRDKARATRVASTKTA
jgi:small subunit ribosomal protein S20